MAFPRNTFIPLLSVGLLFGILMGINSPLSAQVAQPTDPNQPFVDDDPLEDDPDVGEVVSTPRPTAQKDTGGQQEDDFATNKGTGLRGATEGYDEYGEFVFPYRLGFQFRVGAAHMLFQNQYHTETVNPQALEIVEMERLVAPSLSLNLNLTYEKRVSQNVFHRWDFEFMGSQNFYTVRHEQRNSFASEHYVSQGGFQAARTWSAHLIDAINMLQFIGVTGNVNFTFVNTKDEINGKAEEFTYRPLDIAIGMRYGFRTMPKDGWEVWFQHDFNITIASLDFTSWASPSPAFLGAVNHFVFGFFKNPEIGSDKAKWGIAFEFLHRSSPLASKLNEPGHSPVPGARFFSLHSLTALSFQMSL